MTTSPTDRIASATPGEKVPSIEQTLRRLFLTVFLRGRSSRGLQQSAAPRSLGRKLAFVLFFYAFFGVFATALIGQPVFALAVYLHGMSFIFLAMFVAGSAGEVLFNREEADILMHRPVTAGQLLRAKISVMAKVSLWLAGAFNLTGFLVGMAARDGGWPFPLVHILSLIIEILFCAGAVVMGYQLCLRWFGRDRVEGWMTTAQVLVSITFVVGGQLVPRVIMRNHGQIEISSDRWWALLVPPAWFAGLDDALAGWGSTRSWLLAGTGIAATLMVCWFALSKLAGDYGAGLQALSESPATVAGGRQRNNWVNRLTEFPPLCWILREPAARATFILVGAYLLRDRDVKLRVFPGLAPILVVPIIFLFQDRGGLGGGSFGLAFAGSYVGLIPLMSLSLLRYSQQWQATDMFRMAPVSGPAPFCRGVRWAVHCFLTLPMLLCFTVILHVMSARWENIFLMLPGIIALPVYALIPCLGGKAMPLSVPPEEGRSASRGASFLGAIFVSMALSGVALLAWNYNVFVWLIVIEAAVVLLITVFLGRAVKAARWPAID